MSNYQLSQIAFFNFSLEKFQQIVLEADLLQIYPSVSGVSSPSLYFIVCFGQVLAWPF